MKVLVATDQTQGQQSDDFCHTLAGELVRLPTVVCDCPDCGCDRAVEGLTSHKATTTFAVIERGDLEISEYRRILRDHLVDGGWTVGALDDDENSWVDESVDRHVAIAGRFNVGDVLEIRNGQVRARPVAAAGRTGGRSA